MPFSASGKRLNARKPPRDSGPWNVYPGAVTRPEMEASLRDVRASVLELWNRSTDPALRTVADDAYKKLSAVLRAWHDQP